jgi:hypothetical protein
MNHQLTRATRRLLDDIARDVVTEQLAIEITTLAALDPFGIDDPCPGSPDGHFPIWDGPRTLVCPHCSKVLWS